MTSRFDALASDAPDVIAAWRGINAGAPISVRREVRRRAGEGSTARIVAQLAAVATALADVVEGLPERAFLMPGGEGDWNVAQAIGHTASARAGLVTAASMAASGRWPADASVVVPGVPGAADAPREDLLRRLPRASGSSSGQRGPSPATRLTPAHWTSHSWGGSGAASGCCSRAYTT